jgi:hypothetical protein
MPININCIHNNQGGWCKNKKVKRSLFGIGTRLCIKFPKYNKKCEFEEKYSRPDIRVLRKIFQQGRDCLKIRPIIVCLCGSTRFGDAFKKANLEETLAGKIVLSIGCNMKSDAELFAHLSPEALEEIKSRLDELHKRKIDLADEVYILNVGGYIGESTQSEINYAINSNKKIRFLNKCNFHAIYQAKDEK